MKAPRGTYASLGWAVKRPYGHLLNYTFSPIRKFAKEKFMG